MYCPECGVINEEGRKTCSVCRAGLDKDVPPVQPLQIDLTRVHLSAIAWALRRKSLADFLLGFPILALVLLIYKGLGKKFPRPVYLSQTPRFRLTGIGESKEACAEDSYDTELKSLGFERVVELKDESAASDNTHRLYRHRGEKAYADLLFVPSGGPRPVVTFFGIYKTRMLAVSNDPGLRVVYPAKVELRNHKGLSVADTWAVFFKDAESFEGERHLLKTPSLIRLIFQFTRMHRRLGLAQRLYVASGPAEGTGPSKATALWPCRCHPGRPAVRTCAGCGVYMCDACANPADGKHYCDKCLALRLIPAPVAVASSPSPVKTKPTAALVAIPDGLALAGFGERAASALIDAFLVLLVSGLFWYGLRLVLELVVSPGTAAQISSIAGIFVLFGLTIFYPIVPLVKYGRTVGQRVFGLRMIDESGCPPDMVAAVIRFAYFAISLVFVFPALGFLFILFTKTKQGLHDRLAGLYVVGRRSLVKTLAGWAVVIGLVTAPLVVGAIVAGTMALSLLQFWAGGAASEVLIEPVWVREFPTEKGEGLTGIVSGDVYYLSHGGFIEAMDPLDGRTLWRVKEGPAYFPPIDYDPTYPYLVVLLPQSGGGTNMAALNRTSGLAAWKTTIGFEMPNLQRHRDLLVLSESEGELVQVFDAGSGDKLWERRFGAGSAVDCFVAEKGILAAVYSPDDKVNLFYLDRRTGETVWEEQESVYWPVLHLDQDRWLFSVNGDRSVLMDLAEHRVLWESGAGTGYAVVTDRAGERDTPAMVFTNSAALSADDGATLYEFPPGTYFNSRAEDFLILVRPPDLSTDQDAWGGVGILLIDEADGRVLAELDPGTVQPLIKLAEDEWRVYLTAPGATKNPLIQEVVLLSIDKKTRRHEAKLLGRNLSFANIAYYPDRGEVFIPTNSGVGLYRLP